MNALFSAAKEIGEFMDSQGWEYCVIGGLAVLRWGEPRMTRDIDLSLLTGVGREKSFIQPLLSQFPSRLSDALTFALENRVLLLRTSNGTDVDVSLGALNFEFDMHKRATLFEFAPDCVLPVCSAEDLFIMKAFAARDRDRIDAESIVTRSGSSLDTAYIMKHLELLAELKESSDIIDWAREVIEIHT